MLLNKLSKREKELFLELSVYTANVDGIFCPEEVSMISEYRREMDLSESDYKLHNSSYTDIVTELQNNLSNEGRKIVLIELMGLVKADNVIETSERTLLGDLKKDLDISENDYIHTEMLIGELKAVYDKIFKFVNLR